MGKTDVVKRGKGRPAEQSVGRDTLLETAKRLIKVLPPARVTISLIAREAGVDPALVRYYFGDRSKLLDPVRNFPLRCLFASLNQARSEQGFGLINPPIEEREQALITERHLRPGRLAEFAEQSHAFIQQGRRPLVAACQGQGITEVYEAHRLVKLCAFGSANLGGFLKKLAGTIEVALFDGRESGVVDGPGKTVRLGSVLR